MEEPGLNKDIVVSPAKVREPRWIVRILLSLSLQRRCLGGTCSYKEPVFCVSGCGSVSSCSKFNKVIKKEVSREFVHTVAMAQKCSRLLIFAAGEYQATPITAALVLLFVLPITVLSVLCLLPVAVGWLVC